MTRKYTIIVAEDEELLLNNLINKIYALDLGIFVAGKAQTGEQALELIRKHSPDILITDIRMPVMDGMELLARVSETYPGLKTVILSGYSDFDYAKKAIRYNVSDYLLKPVNNDELKQTLVKIITRLEMETTSLTSTLSIPEISSKEQTVEAIREYIQANYDKNLNLEEVISRLNYSSNYITKIFSNIYGMSPVKYLISLRIHKAQHLLVHNPELTIQNIGELIGYPEVSYFSRIFKKYTGTSPGHYRESERKQITTSSELLFPKEEKES